MLSLLKITGCHVGFCSKCSESNVQLHCSIGKWFKCKLCRPTLFPREGGGGYAVTQLVETLCYKPEGRWFDSQWGHPAALGPWLETASNRNEYEEYVLGLNAGCIFGLSTLPPTYTDCLDTFNVLQPQGHVQVCVRVTLPSLCFQAAYDTVQLIKR